MVICVSVQRLLVINRFIRVSTSFVVDFGACFLLSFVCFLAYFGCFVTSVIGGGTPHVAKDTMTVEMCAKVCYDQLSDAGLYIGLEVCFC